MKFFFTGFLLYLLVVSFQPRLPSTLVEVEGRAERRADRLASVREAIRDAQQRAVEQVVGIRIAGLEIGRDYRLQQSAYLTFTRGLVLRWEPVGDPIEDPEKNLVRVRIRAWVVEPGELRNSKDWRELWQTIGHPPIRLVLEYEGAPQHKRVVLREGESLFRHGLQEIGVYPSSPILTADQSPWVLKAQLRVRSVSPKGNKQAPYGIGELVASWNVQLTLQLLQEVHTVKGKQETQKEKKRVICPLGQWQATAASLTHDEEAVVAALKRVWQQSLEHEWRITLSQIWIDSLLRGTTHIQSQTSANAFLLPTASWYGGMQKNEWHLLWR